VIPHFGHRHRPAVDPVVHRFEFAPAARPLLAVLGIRPATAWIRVDGRLLDIRFGARRVATTLDDVEAAETTGPLPIARTLGVRHSPDDVLVFGSGSRGGVRIRFARPVRGLDRPTLVVTVVAPELLVARLRRSESLTAEDLDRR
jgi:hypothetical protein